MKALSDAGLVKFNRVASSRERREGFFMKKSKIAGKKDKKLFDVLKNNKSTIIL